MFTASSDSDGHLDSPTSLRILRLLRCPLFTPRLHNHLLPRRMFLLRQLPPHDAFTTLAIPSAERDSPLFWNSSASTLYFISPLPETIKCPIDLCNVAFTTRQWTTRKRSILRHLRNVHHRESILPRFYCSYCSSVLGNYPTTHDCLRKHGATIPDQTPGLFRCDQCAFSCHFQLGLKNHVDGHSRLAFRRTI